MSQSVSPGALRTSSGTAPFLIAVAAAFAVSLLIVDGGVGVAAGGVAVGFVVVCSFIEPRFSLYAIAVAMLLSPEFQVGSTGPRAIVIRVEDLLIPLAALALLARRATRRDERFLLRPLLLPMVALTLARVVSTWYASADGILELKTGLLFVAKTGEYFLLYFLALNGLRTRRDADRVLGIAIAIALLVGIVATFQIGGPDRLGVPFEAGKPEPNTFGGYLALMIALVGGLSIAHPAPRVRLASLPIVVLLLVPLIFTASRASYAAVAVAGCTLAMLHRRLELALMLVALVAVGVFLVPDSFQDRMSSTLTVIEGPFETQIELEESAASKLRSWQWFPYGYATRPLLGWGMAGAGLIDVEYPRLFAESGVVGLLAFLWLLVEFFRLGKRGCRSPDQGTRALAMGLVAGVAGLLIHALAANTFLIIRIMEPTWFLAGVLAFRVRMDEREQEQGS